MSLIRLRTGSDIDELVALASRVRAIDGYPVYLPNGDFHRFLSTSQALAAWVAEAGGRIVGHVATKSDSNQVVMNVVRGAGIGGEIGVIARLLVDPSTRRQGIGAKLLDVARSHIVALDRTPVLSVVAGAAPAISLYRRTGWSEIGEATFEMPGQTVTELVFTVSS